MMILQIFSPLLTKADTFQGNKIGDNADVISYTYRKKLYGVGEFSLTVPIHSNCANQIGVNTILFADKRDWLIVKNVLSDQEKISISGYDLCGILHDRITLYGTAQDVGTYGYDVVQGSTETVLKHYIRNNISAPSDANRKVVGFIVAEDQQRGLSNDTYMSRFERVSDLAEKICKNGNIGYDVTVDLKNNRMLFDVVPIIDKSEAQNEKNRVVFAIERGNILTLERELGVTNSKNVFYATKSGETLESDATTVMVTDSADVPVGINRREMQLNVSCDSVSEIGTYALKDAENYRETDSFTVSPSNAAEYGMIYDVGDKVTIKSSLHHTTMDAVITEAERSVSRGENSVVIVLGDAKPKYFKQIDIKINNKGV